MSRLQHPAGPVTGALRSHHIDAVAHHFLSTDDALRPGVASGLVRDVAVAAPGSGRSAACVAAGLAAAAIDGWASCLVEDETVAWSAFSYLGGAEPAAVPPFIAADLPPGVRARWPGAWGDGPGSALPSRWLRWRLLGEASQDSLPAWEMVPGLPLAARSAPPRWAALVWCVGAGEAASAAAAGSLGRLVNLLRPGRVEFLVVPDAWEARPGSFRLIGRRSDPGWRNPAHLQDVARMAAGSAPVCVRIFPDAADSGAGTGLLAEIAATIAGRTGNG